VVVVHEAVQQDVEVGQDGDSNERGDDKARVRSVSELCSFPSDAGLEKFATSNQYLT